MAENETISKIRKRDGRILEFDKNKITEAIWKAARYVGGQDKDTAKKLSNKVVEILEKRFKGRTPSVEEIQDVVEKVLIESGHAKTAKAYILYRQRRAELRKEKQIVLGKDEVDEVDKRFDLNALRVLKARYLRKDEQGKLIEIPKELFARVALHTALPDLVYDEIVYDKSGSGNEFEVENFDSEKNEDKFSIGKYKLNRYHLEALKRMYDRFNKQKQMKVSWSMFLEILKKGEFNKYEKTVDKFYEVMAERLFMPNTPALANFGNPLGMGSACFVLGIDDSIESIMDTLKKTAVVFKAGGGMGYNFSRLRPEGDFVSSTSGIASGPISFMRLFDMMTEVIKQGGIRRGANMGILNSNHPDIEKFIKAKEGNKALRNFNISLLMMPDFWKHYDEDKPYPLVNPRNGEVIREVNSRMLFDMVVYQAWESAEPGVIFFDHVNKYNPFYKHLGPILTTNPCVSADTLVPTGNGLERIAEIESKNIVVDARTMSYGSFDHKTMQLGSEILKLGRRVKSGYKKTYKLVTMSGYELIATPDHKVLTENGWKEVSKLIRNEDSVLIQSGTGKFNSNPKLPFEVKNEIKGENGVKYSFNLPSEWNRELGWVIGWILGDGWLNEKYNQIGLVFSEEDREARELIQPIFERYCNRKIKPSNKGSSAEQLRTNSKFVVNFFKDLGVNDVGEEKRVPERLFTATEEGVIGFLEALFSSDGTIGMAGRSRNYIRLNSSSLRLLKDTQLLLLNLGIRSTIYERSTKPKTFVYINRKGKKKEYKTSGINFELNISKENVLRFLKKISFFQIKNKNKINKLGDFEFYGEYFVDKVKALEYVGVKEVWDIAEPITHSFIANGIVVHNCGEVLAYPNESCNLGSINVWAFAKENENGEVYFDWDGLKEIVKIATRFLDNVIDVNKFPLKEIEEMTLKTRKIGLGVMGLGDLLYEIRLPYNGESGRNFMEQLMEFINYHSKIESIEIAKERGSMPYFDKSFYPDGKLPFAGFEERERWHFNWNEVVENIKKHGIRNGFTTVIAPTGSISMIAGCSSGIEPVYSLVFEKNVKVGSFYYIDPVFEKTMRREELYDDDLMREINEGGGRIQGIAYIPPALKEVFVTALDISPEDHIRALATFQKWVDSSISKTINFPASATVDDMRKSYLLAYKLGCKDVTVFRDTSIKDQVLVAPKKKEEKSEVEYVKKEVEKPETLPLPKLEEKKSIYMSAKNRELKECPNCDTKLAYQESCVMCPECGWGLCV